MNENDLNVSLDAVLDAADGGAGHPDHQALSATVEGRRWLALAGALAELPEPVPVPDLAPAVMARLADPRVGLPKGSGAGPAAAPVGLWSRLSAWLTGLGVPAGPTLALAGALGVVLLLALAAGGSITPGSISGTATELFGSERGWVWLAGGVIALVAGLVWWGTRRR